MWEAINHIVFGLALIVFAAFWALFWALSADNPIAPRGRLEYPGVFMACLGLLPLGYGIKLLVVW